MANDPDVWYTGLAMVNPNAGPARVIVEVFDTEGMLQGSVTENIPAHARISKVVLQLLPALPPMSRGYFKVRSDLPVVSFAVFGAHSLSSVSAIPSREQDQK